MAAALLIVTEQAGLAMAATSAVAALLVTFLWVRAVDRQVTILR